MIKGKKKIGEILVDSGFITKEMLSEALEYQKNFGGNVTQYLVSSGFIDEMTLARCISNQFGCPYLPLWAYDIPENIIAMLPPEIAQKHWLLPVDKMGNLITVVMSDPFDETAIADVEKITGCKVQPFVGLLSDILKAIERYYGVHVETPELKKAGKATDKAAPLFITTKQYSGAERRRSLRINAKITIHFPVQNKYIKTETKDISMHGLLFESASALPIGAFIVLQMQLPEDISLYPIAVVAQVARVVPLGVRKYDIGTRIIKIPKEDLDVIMKYAMSVRKD